MWPTRALLVFGLTSLMSCGGAQEAPRPPPSPVRTAVADANLRRLFLDVASTKACNALTGRFIALPTETGAALVPVDGGVPVSGRWLVRTCRASIDANALHLTLGGPGWQWVDRYGDPPLRGFHVKQYVYFDATIELSGTLDVGYDPSSHIASLWLTPTGDVLARVNALGNVNAHPETIGASILGGIGSVFGISPDVKAREKAGVIGAQQFRNRLTNGVTVTFDAAAGQLDLVVGQLPD